MEKDKKMVEPEQRHNFFLSPYPGQAWTRCPQCTEKTKQRIFPVVVSVESGPTGVIRQKCKFCPECDLLIIQQTVLEGFLAKQFHDSHPEIMGNDYLALGTLDNKDWNAQQKGKITPAEVLSRIRLFKKHLQFDTPQYGWVLKKDE